MHLRRGSHTTHMPSTAFRGTPVGALENHGHISTSVHRFSNYPDSHSHDLENSHLSQPRALTLFHPYSHFSYLTYGYYWLLYIYSHTYPPPPSPVADVQLPHPFAASRGRVGSHSPTRSVAVRFLGRLPNWLLAIGYSLFPVIQKTHRFSTRLFFVTSLQSG